MGSALWRTLYVETRNAANIGGAKPSSRPAFKGYLRKLDVISTSAAPPLRLCNRKSSVRPLVCPLAGLCEKFSNDFHETL